jgi:hypothetical protein
VVRSQPLDDQRDDEIGGFGCGDAVVGCQPSVRHMTDQRCQRVGHQSRRGSQHFAALLGSDDERFDVIDEPLVDAAEAVVKPVV